MKKVFVILALCFCEISLFAQSDWDTYKFADICSFKIPQTMEMRNPDSAFGTVVNRLVREIEIEFDQTLPDKEIKFQQKGLNSEDEEVHKKASSLYARILVADILMDSEINQSNIPLLTAKELEFIDKTWKKECLDIYRMLNPNGSFVWYPLKRQKFGGNWAFVTSYRRESLATGTTFIKEYKFFFRKHMLRFTISYRDSEKDIWAEDFSKIMQTLRFL